MLLRMASDVRQVRATGGEAGLLILTRKIGETIAIGDSVKVQVIDIKGRQVRLGIQAPPDTSVHREEVFQRIQEQNRQAAALTPADLSAVADLWATRQSRESSR